MVRVAARSLVSVTSPSSTEWPSLRFQDANKSWIPTGALRDDDGIRLLQEIWRNRHLGLWIQTRGRNHSGGRHGI
jgi:hypothetical protein